MDVSWFVSKFQSFFSMQVVKVSYKLPLYFTEVELKNDRSAIENVVSFSTCMGPK